HRARPQRALRAPRPRRRRAHRPHHGATRPRRHVRVADGPVRHLPGSRPGNPPGSLSSNRLGGPSGNSPGNRIAVDAHDGSGTAMTTIASNMPAAEWAKPRDLPRSRQLLITTIAAAVPTAVVLVLTFPATRGTALSAATAEEVLSTSVLGIDAAAAVLVVLAAWFTGVEFRTGAITESLLRTRRRS